MNVKIYVSENLATVAIQHYYYYRENEPIRNIKAFKEAVSSYVSLYGELCVDDHETENAQWRETAEAIVEKYYSKCK